MKRIVLVLFLILLLYLIVIWLFPSNNRVVLKVNRFEQELFSITSENIIQKSNTWEEDFGSFNEVFTTKIMQISSNNKEEYYNSLLDFTNNKDMREAYDSTYVLFSNISDIINDLEIAFGQFSSSFPTYPIPEITTFFGGFNYAVVTYDNNIAVGLENFLGKNSKYYKYLGDPQYLRFQKQRIFIPSNVIEVWFNEHFQRYLLGKDLLSHIVHKGKMMYFLDKMLPQLDMQAKFRFTKKQMDWVEENEASIWQYFVEEDLLFSNNESEFRSFINYAPFAKGMPKESPGRVAYFIGYKMVSDYMQNNEIDTEELMFLTNSRQFLKLSKYKPTK